jgi:hypothetical protein
MTAYSEPNKIAAGMSFYSGDAQKVFNMPPPTPEQVEAAKNVVFREPDADALGMIIFGEPV